MSRLLIIMALAFMLGQNALPGDDLPTISTLRVPDEGIQPQVAVGHDGTIHLIYFKGAPSAGNLFYVRSDRSSGDFSEPTRVNSQADSAIAVGTIRGAHLALGKDDRAHVAWNGSGKATPKGPANPDLPEDSPYRLSAPMLYTRMDNTRNGFEPQRNLMTHTYSLDGGGSVAADALGNVYVVWHANSLDDKSRGEGGRAVWVATSRDGGQSFARESRAHVEQTGACGCCGLRAHADARGNIYVLYRSAQNSVNRDMYALVSTDGGVSFNSTKIDNWEVDRCVMSSAALHTSEEITFAAWETKHQVKFAALDGLTTPSPLLGVVPDSSDETRKHPVLATNAKGHVILAWTEGTGWQKGGAVAWQVFDKSGKAVPNGQGRAEGLPVWSFAAVYSRPDGFTVVY